MSTQDERTGRSIVDNVVHEIAYVEDVDPNELTPPLYDAVDPDALELLVKSPAFRSLRFDYNGWTVVIRKTGGVELYRADLPL